LKLLAQWLRPADAQTIGTPTNASAIKSLLIAVTTPNSTKVKPLYLSKVLLVFIERLL
jgi:hypothetical protein